MVGVRVWPRAEFRSEGGVGVRVQVRVRVKLSGLIGVKGWVDDQCV